MTTATAQERREVEIEDFGRRIRNVGDARERMGYLSARTDALDAYEAEGVPGLLKWLKEGRHD